MPFNALIASLVSLSETIGTNWSSEVALTDAVALALRQQGVQSFWTNPKRGTFLQGCVVVKGVQGTKIYDLSWAHSGSQPMGVANVKLGNRSNQSQEPLLFLADVALAALDYSLHQLPSCAFVALPGGPKTPNWKNLASLDGTVRLILDPAYVLARKQARTPSPLVDISSRTIKPATDADLSRILTASTNTRLVGIYGRPGRLEIIIDASVTLGKGATFILYRINSVICHDMDNILTWWP